MFRPSFWLQAAALAGFVAAFLLVRIPPEPRVTWADMRARVLTCAAVVVAVFAVTTGFEGATPLQSGSAWLPAWRQSLLIDVGQWVFFVVAWLAWIWRQEVLDERRTGAVPMSPWLRLLTVLRAAMATALLVAVLTGFKGCNLSDPLDGDLCTLPPPACN